MPTDQVTAENEKQIDADPAEAIDAAGRSETEKRGVVDRNDDDGKGAEKIETGLALTIGEARIDFGRKRSEVGSQRSERSEDRGWRIEDSRFTPRARGKRG